jgi:hypothetical protein
MNLPPGVVQYLLIGQAFIPIFINFTINFVTGWLTFRGSPTVSTWAFDKGAALDTIGTCYFLPAITCLICTTIVRRHVQRGVMPLLPIQDAPRWIQWFRGHLLWRATKFGIVGLTVFAGPVYAAYCVFAEDTISTPQFLLIKIAFAVALGIVVTPLIALVALTDEPKT